MSRRPLLLPLVPLYRAGLWWASRNRRTPASLQHPVLSVGSVSAGGAGKTPFTLALARLLQSAGYTVSILSRGYGRTSTRTVRVDPAGNAATFGDEPLLLARALDVPVYVGNSRHAAGLLAERDLAASPAPHVHLLDDGFSHHALARTADIALLTAEDVRDTLLPAGNLREPLQALRRATVLVVRSTEQEVVGRFLAASPALHGKPVWIIDRTLVVPDAPPSAPLLFSAVARPSDLARDLRTHGLRPAGTRSFPDHHRYTMLDILELCSRARRAHANGFLTTGKDAVKLDPGMLAQLATAGPLAVLDVAVHFDNPQAVLAHLRTLLPPT